MTAKLTPAEEMIWSKAFIMERERYDGADVVHLLDARAERLNWPRLLDRMGPHWRVLLSHLIQFGYIYPGEGHRIPAWVMKDLLDRIQNEVEAPASATPLCRGTLVSREQYLHDVERQGYIDARLPPTGTLSAEDIAIWTAGIDERFPEAREQ